MMPRLFRSPTFLGLLAASVLLAACRPADDAAKQGGAASDGTPRVGEAPIPQIVSKEGRHALMVDGAPFLILGAQVNNSSNWPQALDDVWPAIDVVKPNTVMVPVAWEQVEAKEGTFDFSFVD